MWPRRSLPAAVLARVCIIVAALVALGVVAADYVTRSQPPGVSIARVIRQGEAGSRFVTDEDAQDDALSGDEEAAGGMWAKAHRPRRADECPAFSVAFRKGCAGDLTDRKRPR